MSAAHADLPLFMEAPAHNGTRTSRDAAADIRPHAAKQRSEVLVFMVMRGEYGATQQEVEIALGMSGNSVRPRMCELLADDCLRKTERTRKTTSGRNAVVWEYVKPKIAAGSGSGAASGAGESRPAA